MQTKAGLAGPGHRRSERQCKRICIGFPINSIPYLANAEAPTFGTVQLLQMWKSIEIYSDLRRDLRCHRSQVPNPFAHHGKGRFFSVWPHRECLFLRLLWEGREAPLICHFHDRMGRRSTGNALQYTKENVLPACIGHGSGLDNPCHGGDCIAEPVTIIRQGLGDPSALNSSLNLVPKANSQPVGYPSRRVFPPTLVLCALLHRAAKYLPFVQHRKASDVRHSDATCDWAPDALQGGRCTETWSGERGRFRKSVRI